MTRSSKLEELRWKKFPVLNDGFVCLVDVMGDDFDIAQAARVSYGAGTKQLQDDKGLIRYLMRHKHMGPFEMCEVKLMIRIPMDTWRQCLTGDNELHFETGDGLYRRKQTIDEAFECLRTPFANRQLKRRLRCYDETTGKYTTTTLKNIWFTGRKPVYKITIKNPYDQMCVTCTADHPILTENGWLPLKDFVSFPKKTRRLNPSTVKIMTIGLSRAENRKAESFKVSYTDLETWKDIPGYSRYEISSHGRVRRKDTSKLKAIFVGTKDNYSRLFVTLQRDDIPTQMKKIVVSKLVASAFLSGEGHCVRHLDGNSFNNHISNLAYGSCADNMQDAIQNGSFSKVECVAKLMDIECIEYKGVQNVYDIEVESDQHNFVCGGVVVHNCIRHRTFNVNEYSTRYSEAIDSMYCNKSDEWRSQAKTARQSSGEPLPIEIGQQLTQDEMVFQGIARGTYNQALKSGVAREQARKNLPLSTYTEAFWKSDLRNMLHMLELRQDKHAQWEMRQYANIIAEEIIQPLFPITYAAYVDFIKNGVYLSALEQEMIKHLLQSNNVSFDISSEKLETWLDKHSRGEVTEACEKLKGLGIMS